MRRHHGAFTMVEILVVLVIIMVLIATLLPVLSKVREKARQSTCLSNQRQIGITLSTYIQDGVDTYPSDFNDSLGLGSIMHCPSLETNAAVQVSYGMNSFLCGVAVGNLKQTTTVLVTADARRNILVTKADADPTRHKDGFIASFADGHAAHLDEKTPVIWGEGDQGTIYSFAAINTPVTFSDAGTATCLVSGVVEGEAVLLLNTSSAPITAHVTRSGGDTPPLFGGLDPAKATLEIDPGMGRAFSLNCWLDSSAGNQKVPTTYKFGDDPNAVSLLVTPPVPLQAPGY